MKRNLLVIIMMFAVILPAFGLLVGGQPIPEAPASVSYISPPPTIASAVDIGQLRQDADRAGLVPATVIRISNDADSPCAGRGSACEGRAKVALPGPEWQAYMTLESLRRDFEDACGDWTAGANDRRDKIRDDVRRFAAPYLAICANLAADDDYRAAFCSPLRC